MHDIECNMSIKINVFLLLQSSTVHVQATDGDSRVRIYCGGGRGSCMEHKVCLCPKMVHVWDISCVFVDACKAACTKLRLR